MTKNVLAISRRLITDKVEVRAKSPLPFFLKDFLLANNDETFQSCTLSKEDPKKQINQVINPFSFSDITIFSSEIRFFATTDNTYKNWFLRHFF